MKESRHETVKATGGLEPRNSILNFTSLYTHRFIKLVFAIDFSMRLSDLTL